MYSSTSASMPIGRFRNSENKEEWEFFFFLHMDFTMCLREENGETSS